MSYAIRALVDPENVDILEYEVSYVDSEGVPVPNMGLFTGTREECIDLLHYINGGSDAITFNEFELLTQSLSNMLERIADRMPS